VRDRLDELGDGVDVVLITFSETEHLDDYQKLHDLPFPILVDRNRSSYGAFGLGRGSLGRVWGWKTLRRYAQILRETGFGPLHNPTEDTRQLGGDFVIAPDGTLAWGFWSEGPDDRPSVDELIAQVQAATAPLPPPNA
jgi:hypothetical protein